jgi:hypothetical protein
MSDMSEETRAQLRTAFVALLSATDGGMVAVRVDRQRDKPVDVEMWGSPSATVHLTTEKQLALSVLLGDQTVSVAYVLDKCQDDGSFVLRSADEVRAEERERILSAVCERYEHFAGDEHPSAVIDLVSAACR